MTKFKAEIHEKKPFNCGFVATSTEWNCTYGSYLNWMLDFCPTQLGYVFFFSQDPEVVWNFLVVVLPQQSPAATKTPNRPFKNLVPKWCKLKEINCRLFQGFLKDISILWPTIGLKLDESINVNKTLDSDRI